MWGPTGHPDLGAQSLKKTSRKVKRSELTKITAILTISGLLLYPERSRRIVTYPKVVILLLSLNMGNLKRRGSCWLAKSLLLEFWFSLEQERSDNY